MLARFRQNRFMIMFSVWLSMMVGAVSSVNALNDPDLGLFCGDYNSEARAEMRRLWAGTPLEASLPDIKIAEKSTAHCGACTVPHAATVVKSLPLPTGPVPALLGHDREPNDRVPLPSPYELFSTRAPPARLS